MPAFLFALLCWGAFEAGKHVLAKDYHAFINQWNYSFPSTLTFEGIDAQPSDALSIVAERLTLSWKWRDLVHSRNGISFHHIKLERLDVQIETSTYHLVTKLDRLDLSKAILGSKQVLDSLIIVAPQIQYQAYDTIGSKEDGDPLWEPLELPSLSIKYFELDSGTFIYFTDSMQHSASNVQMVADKINSDSLFSTSLKQLSLNYQDTLAMDLKIDRVEMDSKLATLINGLHMTLPGLSLNTEIDYAMLDSIGTLGIDSSYLTIGLIRSFLPAASEWIHKDLPDDERIWVEARVRVLSDHLDLQRLTLSLLDSTVLRCSGTFNYVEPLSAFNMSEFRLTTQKEHLHQLIAPNPALSSLNWPSSIHFAAAAHGTTQEIAFHTDLYLPAGSIHTVGKSSLGSTKTIDLSADVKDLPLDQLIRDLPVAIPQLTLVSHLHAELADDNLHALIGELQIVDLPINELRVDTVQVTFERTESTDSVRLTVSDNELIAELEAQYFEADTSELFLLASIDVLTDAFPDVAPYLEAGAVQLSAKYQWHQESFASGGVIIDRLGLTPTHKTEQIIAGTQLNYRKVDDRHKAHLQLPMGQYANLEWNESLMSNDSLGFLSAIEHVDINFWIDSLWRGTLGEEQWALQLDTLQVDYTAGQWLASMSIPHMAFGDYSLDGLQYSFACSDTTQKGLLSATHFENPFLQDLSMELSHDGTFNDTNLELGVMIKESQQAIRVPLRFRTLAEGYSIGFSDSLPLTQPDLKWHGVQGQDIVISQDLKEAHGRLVVMARSAREPSIVELFVNHTERNTVLDLLVEHADLEPIKQVVHWPEDLALTGLLYADMHLAYRDSLAIDGYVAIDESLLQLPESKTVMKLSEDFIDFDGRQLALEDFTVYDGDDNPLTLNGTVQVMEEGMPFDLTIEGDRFVMVNNDDRSGHFSGHLASRASLHATGDLDQINISGEFEILPDAQLAYYPGETAEIVSTHNSISFLDFEDSTAAVAAPPPVSHAINWDVEFLLNETDFEIILDQESQEFVRFFANGELELVRGEDELPGIFGTIESTKGRAFIGLPTVSDINMIIDRLSLRFDGDVSNPKITFVGHENFPLSPASLDVAFANRQEDVIFQVIFKLDEAT
ncbi:MAG: translocation/assembly module TamB domain-containing protein, partial [Bacteroidota bacterium]